MVIAFEGASESLCADLMTVRLDASDWSKAHPPTRLEVAPTTDPVCKKDVSGVTWTVWGTAAAEYVCASLK